LSILSTFNIPKHLFLLIQSFLSNRSQSVLLNNIYSSTCVVTSGVPQGSILGPLLFLVYIDSVFRIPKSITTCIFGFADDLLLVAPVNSTTTFQSDIDTIVSHLNLVLLLAVNASKTQLIVCNRSTKQLPSFTVNVSNICVNQSLSLKYLGVILDPRLTFSLHCSAKITSVRCAIGALRRTFRGFINDTIRAHIYRVFHRVHFLYCIESVYPVNVVDRTRLERAQKFAIRFILNNHDHSTTYMSLCTLSHLTPLYTIAWGARLKLLYQYINHRRYCADNLITLLATTNRRTNRRNSHSLTIAFPTSNLTSYNSSPYISSANLFNSLTDDVVSLPFRDFVRTTSAPLFLDPLLCKNRLNVDI
jgi:hypothetical protein